jgi:bifunctional non-homologous end joining protein LigD
MPLERYREMRDFERTPEPSGGPSSPTGNRFVVQEHHATALHWDFRLERDGVLVSWAVPKGIPAHPRENRMAVHTEDHPLDYYDFEGDIPEGEYGGGKVILWDQGTYDCEKWNDHEVIVVLHGRRLRGRYALIKTKGKNWLLHRMDPPEDPTREPFPHDLRPMRPTRGPLPTTEGWGYEPVWGGLHVLLANEGGRVELTTENGEAVVERFPEFRPLGRALGALAVILDGEVVVLDQQGQPDPDQLARRAELHSDTALRRASERAPAVFLAGDLVWLEGHSATSLSYRDRRKLLEQVEFAGPTWRVNRSEQGVEAGRALLAAAPGVLSKRLDARYEPGQVSPDAVLTFRGG